MGHTPNNPEPAGQLVLLLDAKQAKQLEGMSAEQKLEFESKLFARQMEKAGAPLATAGMSDVAVARSFLEAGMVQVKTEAEQRRDLQQFGAKMGEMAQSDDPQKQQKMQQTTLNMVAGKYPGAEAPLATEQAFLTNLEADYRLHGNGQVSGLQQETLEALKREFSGAGESSRADITRVMEQAAMLHVLKEKIGGNTDPEQAKQFERLLESNKDLRDVVKKLGRDVQQEAMRDEQEIELPQVKNIADKSGLGRK